MLLSSAVKNDMLDIALDLVQRCPDLIFSGNDATLGLLSTLAETPSLFLSGCQLGFAQRLDYHLRIHIKLPTPWNEQRNIGIEEQERPNELETQREGMKKVFLFRRSEQMYEMKRKHVFTREILRIIRKEISTKILTEPQLNAAKGALFRAVKNGIPEFINEMIRACPALLFSVDGNQRNMIMSAIEHRQEEIFSLIFALDAIKYEITSATDKYGNNMLHLAGLLSPPDRLARASGAALQMQRELQWFKEVESMMSTISKESHNEDGQTPYQVFIKHHRQLMIDGEKWMQGTATTFSTVVGALIITIMFTAAITVPGGTDQNSGYPIFLHKRSFIVFIISDVLSLFAASISVSMFLAILTSGYTEKDFLRPLPEKLFYGLLTLCISMAAMIIAFCAALFIMLKEKPYIVIPISLAATVPVSLFFKMQLGLLKEIWFSTIGPGIFNKKRA
ncbi:hypothetical protein Tsubulata_033749 [Turnera subulata]|uniref:PGG domain-containing protein n=1 Tax=Turnera subulata TaxID=218843 RepID=A0A9Q0FVQ2_9ROSI|nr:hypothetical protein Tsubulata_033749 [Turnera subulata]